MPAEVGGEGSLDRERVSVENREHKLSVDPRIDLLVRGRVDRTNRMSDKITTNPMKNVSLLALQARFVSESLKP